MIGFVYRCPATGLKVQGYLADDDGETMSPSPVPRAAEFTLSIPNLGEC